jgi:hypothetical protein
MTEDASTVTPGGLSLLILAEEEIDIATPEPDDQVQEEGFDQIKERVTRFVRRTAVSKTVDMSKLEGQLAGTQTQVESLLAGTVDHEIAGMRLKEIEVSLGISAGGTIGVVSAGMTASISLTYSKG